jgi:SAM-dependent methyltransferase
MVGIDLALRWLVVGRKRLEEAGVEALLVCCCAEALPFEDGQFDVVVADSAIEHFRDQDRALDSASRILRPEGVLFLATPNGASPGPDPHLGLLGGALLPDRLIRAYARRVGAVPPARHLLTARALLRKLRGAGFAGIEIFAPRISTAQVQGSPRLVRAAVRVYNALGRFGPTRTLRRAIGPLLFAVARRR